MLLFHIFIMITEVTFTAAVVDPTKLQFSFWNALLKLKAKFDFKVKVTDSSIKEGGLVEIYNTNETWV